MLTLGLGRSSTRVMPSVGSGRYWPGPGTEMLLKRVLSGDTPHSGRGFTDPARFPCYRLKTLNTGTTPRRMNRSNPRASGATREPGGARPRNPHTFMQVPFSRGVLAAILLGLALGSSPAHARGAGPVVAGLDEDMGSGAQPGSPRKSDRRRIRTRTRAALRSLWVRPSPRRSAPLAAGVRRVQATADDLTSPPSDRSSASEASPKPDSGATGGATEGESPASTSEETAPSASEGEAGAESPTAAAG